MDGCDVRWTASDGTIDHQGHFIAEDPGDYQIQATVDSLAGTAEVRVRDGIIDPPPGFHWKGSVPPQKWMNFYTKSFRGSPQFRAWS